MGARVFRLPLVIVGTLAMLGTGILPAEARPARAQSRSSVNRNTNVNQNRNVNRNTNVNVNRDVDVDVDVHHYGGGYYGCCYHDYHPVGTAAAVAATAVVTAAVVGSIVNTLPPSCSTIIVNGFSYMQCGSTWYQPQISPTSTTYIVVNAPR
jgi:hypothetical protein